MNKIRWGVLTFFFFLLGGVAPLRGQDLTVPDDPVQSTPEGDAAIARLKSPFCPGLMLEVCTHPDSKILRDTIQVMAQQGASSDSLVEWMLGIYGEEYRAVPKARGSGLFAWVMPPLALVGGLLLMVVALRTFRARRETAPPRSETLSKEEEDLIQDALEELKSAEEVPF